ncbi:TPA: hypothetical protein ACF3XT_004331 [Vibrio parahaemolyticus]
MTIILQPILYNVLKLKKITLNKINFNEEKMLNLSQQIQFGFDIATSITIVATALSWLYTTHKRNNKLEIKSLDEKVQSNCVDIIQNTITISYPHLVSIQEAYHSLPEGELNYLIDFNSEISDISTRSAFIQYLENTPTFITEFESCCEQLSKEISIINDVVESQKYILMPLLCSMRNGDKIINDINNVLKSIRIKNKSIRHVSNQPITNLKNLMNKIEEKKSIFGMTRDELRDYKTLVSKDSEIVEITKKILLKDNLSIWKRFIDYEFEDQMIGPNEELPKCLYSIEDIQNNKFYSSQKGIRAGIGLNDHQVLYQDDEKEFEEICSYFLTYFVESEYKLLMFYTYETRGDAENVLKSCNEFMLNLSAILTRLLSKDTNKSFNDVKQDVQLAIKPKINLREEYDIDTNSLIDSLFDSMIEIDSVLKKH